MESKELTSAKSIAKWSGIIVIGFLFVLSNRVSALSTEFFIGVDERTNITSGDYAGLPNPNEGRLTFLFAHPNETDPSTSHYHSIGAYSYSGPADNPLINLTNTNNRIPETFSGKSALPLLPGSGVHAGHLVSQHVPGLEYSNLQMQSTQSLNGFGAGAVEDFLFHSSDDRWSGALDNVLVGLKLIGITNGLQVADELGNTILSSPNDIYTLGTGNSLSFTPTFFTLGNALSGVYSASFGLVDLNGGALDSGIFHIDFQVSPVPEPTAVLMLLIGLIGIATSRRGKFLVSLDRSALN